MGSGSKTFLLASCVIAAVVGSISAWETQGNQLSASSSLDFGAACDQAFLAIERAERSLDAAAYQGNLSAAEFAIDNADRMVRTSRDRDVVSALRRYRLVVMTLRDTLTFIADSGVLSESALQIQSGALDDVKAQTLRILGRSNVPGTKPKAALLPTI